MIAKTCKKENVEIPIVKIESGFTIEENHKKRSELKEISLNRISLNNTGKMSLFRIESPANRTFQNIFKDEKYGQNNNRSSEVIIMGEDERNSKNFNSSELPSSKKPTKKVVLKSPMS